MALPVPLTAAQVGGALDSNELRVHFNTGPYGCLTLAVSKTDVNLPASVADGSITVENPRTFQVPTISGISPTTMAAAAGGTLTVNGSGFVSGDTVVVDGVDRVTTFVSASQLTAVIGAASFPAGTKTVVARTAAGFNSNSVNLTVT